MAEALLRLVICMRSSSAGTHPGAVSPEAVTVMREIRVDISVQRSKPIRRFKVSNSISLCCDKAREVCPVLSGETERLHWPFEDPASFIAVGEERLRAFRRLRANFSWRFVFAGRAGPEPNNETCRVGGHHLILRLRSMPFHIGAISTRAVEGGHQAESGRMAPPAPSKNPALTHRPKRTLVLLAFSVPRINAMRSHVTENKTLPIFPSWTSWVGAPLLEPREWLELVEHEHRVCCDY